MRSTTVLIRLERTFEEAASGLLPDMVGHLSGDVAILPASLERGDLVAEQVARSLPAGCDVEVMTPLSGSDARKAFVLPTGMGNWQQLPVTTAGTLLDAAILPRALVNARHRIVAVDVVEVARRGPFVLDVPARYAHPRQRLRFATDRARSELTAEVASVLPISLAVVSLILPEGTFLAATTDRIAAELVALALSERCIGATRSFTGPWEDAVVQRATELDLGVLLPSYIRLVSSGSRMREPWADALQEHVRRRLGITGAAS